MSQHLLINNVEQEQPYGSDQTNIVLFGRHPDTPTRRVKKTVVGFDPYFYARADAARSRENEILANDCVAAITYPDEWVSFKDEYELARIEVPKPQDVREARDLFDETWAADVQFTNRFRIDSGMKALVEVPDEDRIHWREVSPLEPRLPDATPGGDRLQTAFQNLEPRTVTLDIETDDRGEDFPEMGEERILSIAAHDSIEDEMRVFVDLDGDDPDERLPDLPDGVDAVRWGRSESDMLDGFVSWFNDVDPDIVTGWNVDGFDLPFLLQRMDNLNAYPSRLSPMGWAGINNYGEPRIKGRTIYDLLTVYKKNSFTELRSYKLDDVAEEELDAQKIQFEGSFYELYRDDLQTFLEYNAHDVRLTKDINHEAGVIHFRDVLRREVGVDFEDSYDNKDFVEMMCRRKLKEMGRVGPTRKGNVPDSDFEGAFVFPPYTGVAKNVVGIDLASLYPYTMAALNASPETLVEGECDDCIQADNGAQFRKGEPGLFKQLVDDAISLKSTYKEKRENAETDEEYERWDAKYSTAKTITNSIYGVTGWEKFFLYEEKVAEAVTLTGQAVIKATAEFVEEHGHEVIYGDTDSTYVRFPEDWSMDDCLSSARELCRQLNDEVYRELAFARGVPAEDHLWEIEVEAFMSRFFQAGKKKRYAYKAIWKDGRKLDEPSVKISGFASKRSDASKLTVETEKAIFDAILNDRIKDVHNIVFEAGKSITAQYPDWDEIGIPGGMNQKIDPDKAGQEHYYAFHPDGYPQGAHPRGVWNANHILPGVKMGSGAKPMRVYLQPMYFEELDREINVIAFERAADIRPLEDTLRVDTSRMTSVLLTRPLERTLAAVDIDVHAAIRGQTQTGLGMFE